MKRARSTLQSRIILFMVVLTAVMIGAFIMIQLQNQVQIMTTHNRFRAQLGGLVARDKLEESMLQAASRSTQEQIDQMTATLKKLSDARIIDAAYIFLKDGTFVSGTSFPSLEDSSVEENLRGIQAGLQGVKEKRWFSSEVRKRGLWMYVPIGREGDFPYVIKFVFSLGNLREALAQVYRPSAVTASAVIFANIFLGLFLSRRVIGPVRTLDKATDVIAGGNLDHRVELKTGDELEELAERFNHMTLELIKMKDRALNANPLTKLPGNVMIQEDVERRIAAGKLFVVIYDDLDNFKAFNDKYGVHKGDEAITMTSDVLKEAMQKEGNPDDFLGHEGGDDFLLVTTPDRAEAIAAAICREFDRRVVEFYSEEDRKLGYIIAKSRTGEYQKFPIMTVSLAGVTNSYRKIQTYAEVTNIAAEVKKKSKAIAGSSYVLDKRTDPSQSL